MRGKLLPTLLGFGICTVWQVPAMAAPDATTAAPAVTTSATTTSTTATTATTTAAAPATKPSTTSSPTAPAVTSVTTSSTTVRPPVTAVAAPPADPKAIEEQLHDLVDTLKKVYTAAQNLQAECSRVYNADALDNIVMDPWMAGQPGLYNVMPPPFPGALKSLPARKKWIDHDQAQLTQLLRMLTNEVNAIGPASSIDSSIKVTVEILQDNMQQVDEQYARLNSLTNPSTTDAKGQPNYDKAAINKTAQALKDETSGMNEIRKRLLRQLKDIGKDK